MVSFVSEVRNDRNDLLKILWKNIEDEFTGELEKGMQSPKDMLQEKLKQTKIADKDAIQLAEEMTSIFITYLQNALGKMQAERFEASPKNEGKS